MSRHQIMSLAVTGFVPLWLGIVIALGGSGQQDQIAFNGLQFVGALIALVCIWQAFRAPWSKSMILFAGLAGLIIAWGALQTLPLSPAIWITLPDRSVLSDGWTALALDADQRYPISFIPSETRTSLLGFAVPVATLMLTLAIGRKQSGRLLYWAIPMLGALSALLGIAQVTTSADDILRWHAITNPNSATGVFANANHQATLCLMCVPWAAALGARVRRGWDGGDDDVGQAVIVGGLFLVNVMGVLTAGSTAGYILLAPTLIFSFLLFARASRSGERGTTATLAITTTTIIGSIALVASSPVLAGIGFTSFENNELTRLGIWETSTKIATTHAAVGTGLGTFTEVYRLYEPDSNITTQYVNAAHNDYIQVVIELGLPGALILSAMLILFLVAFARTWIIREDEDYRFRRAASVSVLIPILHSFVDYPLRTPAVACLAMACLVLMLAPLTKRKKPSTSDAPEQRPGHAVI